MKIEQLIQLASECITTKEPLLLKIPIKQRVVVRQRKVWGDSGPYGRVIETYAKHALVSFDARTVHEWAVGYAKRHPGAGI